MKSDVYESAYEMAIDTTHTHMLSTAHINGCECVKENQRIRPREAKRNRAWISQEQNTRIQHTHICIFTEPLTSTYSRDVFLSFSFDETKGMCCVVLKHYLVFATKVTTSQHLELHMK